jgi:hypothetical protein
MNLHRGTDSEARASFVNRPLRTSEREGGRTEVPQVSANVRAV